MPNPAISQSQKRFQESLGSLFIPINEANGKNPYVFLKSSTDVGVILNGGRNGARFAPKSFLSIFKKMTQSSSLKPKSFVEKEVSNGIAETIDFKKAQNEEAREIEEVIKSFPDSSYCHLGGGHDHIYPLLMALSQTYKKIVVLNIDAHADTRSDENPHSGTPFRQFSQAYEGDFQLFQLGLHPFANSQSTLKDLETGKMTILWREDLNDPMKCSSFYQAIEKEVNKQTAFIFSLDVDALSSSIAPGVSAVNGNGLTHEELKTAWKNYETINKRQSILGIYEMNPVYDSLAMTTVRTLASFVFESL